MQSHKFHPLEQWWFTREESAEYLRVSIRTIDSLREDGRLRAYRLTRKLLFRRVDLDAVLADAVPTPPQVA